MGTNPFARSDEVRAARIHYARGENWMAQGVVFGAQSLRPLRATYFLPEASIGSRWAGGVRVGGWAFGVERSCE